LLSIIDYGLPIYGWCAPSNLRKILPPYHAAVRRSISAFPTTLTKCILAGLPDIKTRVAQTTFKLIPKLMCSTNSILLKDYEVASKQRRKFKVQSTIRRCITFIKRHSIGSPYRWNKVIPSPPWKLRSTAVDITLHDFQKSRTPITTFKQLFEENTHKYSDREWLYTDSSKSNPTTSIEVVDQHGLIVSWGQLPHHFSVFYCGSNSYY